MREAAAEAAAPTTNTDGAAAGDTLAPQVQIDGGLSVIGVGYEHPVAAQLAIQVEMFVFGTYFLPWFDLGQDTKGVGVGIRPTWFANPSGHGLYVTPYVRGVAVSPDTITGFDGTGFTAGAFVGWAFGLTDALDLRVGAGAQYIRLRTETAGQSALSSTPFVAIDVTVGYRL
jgi:hypothetical protein